ncbi:MAG: TetR/AcrR family transcriptional regulator [Propionibacterium sp.]|nr:TetR/AcrR family transcriptional regulator [Propionibacterium sp.]
MKTTTDGRATRWEAHNAERRRELVASTLRAIRKHGAGVGMDDIAAEAATSKPVIYRHFGDKAGLYQAVVDWVNDFIWERLALGDVAESNPHELVSSLADTYLTLVEKDPEIYKFVIARPDVESPVADPVLSITTRIGNQVSDLFRHWLRQRGLDEEPANIWGHGVVGFIWAAADRWIITQLRRPRADVVAYIDQLFAPAFEAQRSQS